VILPSVRRDVEENGGELGIKSHQSHITGDWTAEAFRASTQGSSPGHFLLKDWGLKILGCVSSPALYDRAPYICLSR